MIDIETYFIKQEIVIVVYNSYIDGLSVRDIAYKLEMLYGFILDEKQINNIIDLINTILC